MRLLAAPLFAFATAALAACGGGAGSQGSSVPSSPSSASKGITYSSSGKQLDLCKVPSGTPVRSAAVIFIHGGGFRTGNREQMKNFCTLYSRGGFTSITIDYRLSGEAAYPAALEDANDAIRWMKQRSRVEGFDPDKIVLVGYSAGGSLSLMAGEVPGTEPAARVSVAGISDFDAALRETKLPQLREDLLAFLGGADPASVSPIRNANANYEPTFFFHGKKDALVSVAQSVRMAEQLGNSGAKQLLRVYDNVGHEVMLTGPQLKPLLEDLTAFLVAVDAEP